MIEAEPIEINEYFVGYEKLDDGFHFYTIFHEAILLLKDKIEFEFHHQGKVKYMRSVAPLAKLPKRLGNMKSGYVEFYDMANVNHKVPKGVRKAVAEACDKLHTVDKQRNELLEKHEIALAKLDMIEAQAKGTIRTHLETRGVVVSKGRFIHRAMLIDLVRVYLKTDFSFVLAAVDVDELRQLARKEKKHKTDLLSCIETTEVTIDAKFYREVLKDEITKSNRRKFVTEHEGVNDVRFEEKILPKLPYKLRLGFWTMNDQIDEYGYKAQIHYKTYQASNPECQECGGKFIKKTNVCQDCGLQSFEVKEGGKAKPKAVKKPIPTKRSKTTRKRVMRRVIDLFGGK